MAIDNETRDTLHAAVRSLAQRAEEVGAKPGQADNAEHLASAALKVAEAYAWLANPRHAT